MATLVKIPGRVSACQSINSWLGRGTLMGMATAGWSFVDFLAAMSPHACVWTRLQATGNGRRPTLSWTNAKWMSTAGLGNPPHRNKGAQLG